MDIKLLDVLKWAGASNAESSDVMVVEDVDGGFLKVRHIAEEGMPVTTVINTGDNLKKVGRCTAYEPIAEIVKRYKNV